MILEALPQRESSRRDFGGLSQSESRFHFASLAALPPNQSRRRDFRGSALNWIWKPCPKVKAADVILEALPQSDSSRYPFGSLAPKVKAADVTLEALPQHGSPCRGWLG